MARSIRNAAEYVYPIRNALYSIILPSIVSVVIFMGLWQAADLLIYEILPEAKINVFFHVFYFGWAGDTGGVADIDGLPLRNIKSSSMRDAMGIPWHLAS